MQELGVRQRIVDFSLRHRDPLKITEQEKKVIQKIILAELLWSKNEDKLDHNRNWKQKNIDGAEKTKDE